MIQNFHFGTLAQYETKYQNERAAIIIGNGPELGSVNWKFLEIKMAGK